MSLTLSLCNVLVGIQLVDPFPIQPELRFPIRELTTDITEGLVLKVK